MDVGAEFTLRVARLTQEHIAPRKSPPGWFIVPDFHMVPWDDARDRLEAAHKPLMVVPLTEPGYLGIWSVPDLEPTRRIGAEHHMATRQGYFIAKLQDCGLTDRDAVRLTTRDGQLTLLVPEFLRWVSEYAVSTGVSLERSTLPGVGRILVRPPGGGAPLGLPPSPP